MKQGKGTLYDHSAAMEQKAGLSNSKRIAEGEDGEHLLVCLSGSPSNAKVIRRAARLAVSLDAKLTALFVETPNSKEPDRESAATLKENLKLAKKCGAKVAIVYGGDIAVQIAAYAKGASVTGIVVGRSHGIKTWGYGPPRLEQKLASTLPDLDLYWITGKRWPYYSKQVRNKKYFDLSIISIGKTLGVLCFISLIGLWFYHLGFGESSIVILYVLAVLLIALITEQRWYGAVASLISVLIFNFLFTEPRFTLRIQDPEYLITFFVMFTAAFITSSLTIRAKKQARQAAQKALRTEVLLETSQRLQKAKNQEEIIAQTARQMIRLLNRSVIFYPINEGELGEPFFFPGAEAEMDSAPFISEEERGVAQWVYANSHHAGATTTMYPNAKSLYFAVRSENDVFAVTAIVIDHGVSPEAFEMNLLIAMLGECALALEKEQLMETKNSIAIQVRHEKLRGDLLRAISHDLRTPLTTISGNAGILLNNSDVLSEEKKSELYADIYDDSVWLIDLVENLLSITRIENGTVSLHLEPELMEEVLQEALLHINRDSALHEITVSLEDDFTMALMDSRLIVQVIINLVNNAIRYTKAGSLIAIRVQREGAMVVVEVADDGNGVPDDQKEKLFDMFFTAGNRLSDHRSGMGLGLALCRSIVTAHGGTIYVRDNVPCGAVFGFTLQAMEVSRDE